MAEAEFYTSGEADEQPLVCFFFFDTFGVWHPRYLVKF
jgi:hypothetical protein